MTAIGVRYMCEKYKEIINKPYVKSTRHPPMAPENRAAQFAPFAALSGHAEAIRETERRFAEKMDKNE